MTDVEIALIVGSNRRESINLKLAQALVRLAPDRLRFRLIRIDDLPIYNADLEVEPPETVRRFRREVAHCGAALIVTAEHNRSIPAVLKSAIDWGSKPPATQVWRDKAVAITGTTPGAIGTAVGQQHLRQILGALGALVMGGEAYVQFKPGLLSDKGELADASSREFLGAYLGRFATLIDCLNTSVRA
jgi:chromate reductase, NAD(P)H dehydrogenase (quinone)